jgi:hypothetical protein
LQSLKAVSVDNIFLAVCDFLEVREIFRVVQWLPVAEEGRWSEKFRGKKRDIIFYCEERKIPEEAMEDLERFKEFADGVKEERAKRQSESRIYEILEGALKPLEDQKP